MEINKIMKAFIIITLFTTNFILLVHQRIEYGEASVFLICSVLILFPLFFFGIEDIMKELKKRPKRY